MRFTRGFHGRSRLDAGSARVPPGQYVTHDFPVLSAGPTPHTRPTDWTFTLRGSLDTPISWTWDQLGRCRTKW
jgi:DMSO/TMAO reductase YedYZ molybdopterin-dependent catalytic subunit